MEAILNPLPISENLMNGMNCASLMVQMAQRLFSYLIDMKEEYGEVEEDDDEEREDEYDGQRGEDPQQILQNTQIILDLTKAGPFLQCMKRTHLWTRTDRPTTSVLNHLKSPQTF